MADECVEFNNTFNSDESKEMTLRYLTSSDCSGECYWDDIALKVK